jgi:peptidyl-dipeptidase Dcp
LEGAAARLTDVKSRLAVLGTRFTQNLLAEERGWFMELAEADLAGCRAFVVATAAKAAAESAAWRGHVVTLNRSLIVPFLQFSPGGTLRAAGLCRPGWRAGPMGARQDNRAMAAETLGAAGRNGRALLGYAELCGLQAGNRDGEDPGGVRDLLMRVWEPAKGQGAEADAAVLEAMLHADGSTGRSGAVGLALLQRKAAVAEHDLDEAALKPYLSLEAMLGAFRLRDPAVRAGIPRWTPGPLYHPDARAGR